MLLEVHQRWRQCDPTVPAERPTLQQSLKSLWHLSALPYTQLSHPWAAPGHTHTPAPWGDRAIASSRFVCHPLCDTRELPSEVIHQHLRQTLLLREIQLGFYPNTPSFTQFLSLSSQDLLIKISLAQPKLVFYRRRKKKLSIEAICTAEHTSFL